MRVTETFPVAPDILVLSFYHPPSIWIPPPQSAFNTTLPFFLTRWAESCFENMIVEKRTHFLGIRISYNGSRSQGLTLLFIMGLLLLFWFFIEIEKKEEKMILLLTISKAFEIVWSQEIDSLPYTWLAANPANESCTCNLDPTCFFFFHCWDWRFCFESVGAGTSNFFHSLIMLDKDIMKWNECRYNINSILHSVDASSRCSHFVRSSSFHRFFCHCPKMFSSCGQDCLRYLFSFSSFSHETEPTFIFFTFQSHEFVCQRDGSFFLYSVATEICVLCLRWPIVSQKIGAQNPSPSHFFILGARVWCVCLCVVGMCVCVHR